MTGHSTPGQVIAKLDEIERELANRQNAYEQAADDRARLTRQWDHRYAIHAKLATGANAEQRKAFALVASIEQDDLYARLTDAEARYDALRVVTRNLETRATIGMGILKAQGRS